MALPPLEEIVRQLGELSESPVDSETPLSKLDVDSIDILEWTMVMEDEFGIVLEDDLLRDMQGMSIRGLYDFLQEQPAPPGQEW